MSGPILDVKQNVASHNHLQPVAIVTIDVRSVQDFSALIEYRLNCPCRGHVLWSVCPGEQGVVGRCTSESSDNVALKQRIV